MDGSAHQLFRESCEYGEEYKRIFPLPTAAVWIQCVDEGVERKVDHKAKRPVKSRLKPQETEFLPKETEFPSPSYPSQAICCEEKLCVQACISNTVLTGLLGKLGRKTSMENQNLVSNKRTL